MGAWIEIEEEYKTVIKLAVAPLVGAWIEIANKGTIDWDNVVAPLVGAWIEIHSHKGPRTVSQSLLSWERGLK